MKSLFVGDEMDPEGDRWIVVKSYREAIKWMIQNGCPNYLSISCQLEDDGDHSGYDIAKWIVEHDIKSQGGFIPPEFNFNVRSGNDLEARSITIFLDDYLRYKKVKSFS